MKQGKRGRPKKIKEPEIVVEQEKVMKQERRGRPKEPEHLPPPRKYKKTYEDEDTIEVWTYDLDIHRGPINVDIKYKNGLDKTKNWNKMQRDAKNERRASRQMRKITANQKIKPKPGKKKQKIKSTK